jgi:hypothetical protein
LGGGEEKGEGRRKEREKAHSYTLPTCKLVGISLDLLLLRCNFQTKLREKENRVDTFNGNCKSKQRKKSQLQKERILVFNISKIKTKKEKKRQQKAAQRSGGKSAKRRKEFIS